MPNGIYWWLTNRPEIEWYQPFDNAVWLGHYINNATWYPLTGYSINSTSNLITPKEETMLFKSSWIYNIVKCKYCENVLQTDIPIHWFYICKDCLDAKTLIHKN